MHSLEIISVTQLYHEQLCADLQFIHALKISVCIFFFLYTSNTSGIYRFDKRPQIQHLSSWHSRHQAVLLFAVYALQAGNLCLSSPAQKQVTQSGTSVGLILKDCLLSICPLSTQASPHATLLLCLGGTKNNNNCVSKNTKLTNLAQSPLWLRHHAAADPEKLLGQSGDGRLVPQLWRAHDRRRGRSQGARLLFGLVSGAPDEVRREHARREGPQRLEGGGL